MPVGGCLAECQGEVLDFCDLYECYGLFVRCSNRKITISLSSFMNETDIILAIPGLIVALGVLFDAIFGKG